MRVPGIDVVMRVVDRQSSSAPLVRLCSIFFILFCFGGPFHRFVSFYPVRVELLDIFVQIR
jgi:hypothetical protein